MEKDFDISNFEESLRRNADDFVMIPSKQVWNGIYNHLHPGSRWPSITIALFFLMTLVGVGYWNHSSQSSHAPGSTTRENTPPVNSNLQEDNQVKGANKTSASLEKSNNPAEILGFVESNTAGIVEEEISLNANRSGLLIRGNFEIPTTITNGEYVVAPVIQFAQGRSRYVDNVKTDEIIGIESASSGSKGVKGHKNLIEVLPVAKENAPDVLAPKQQKGKTKNKGIEFIFYLTPSISSVYFKGKPVEYFEPVSGASPLIFTPNNVGNSMRVNAKVGLNAGAQLKIRLNENLKLLTGAQVSMEGYNVLANRVHPTFAYLVLKERGDSYAPRKYITFYGNGSGEDQIMLHNANLRISVPIGLEQTVWKTDQVEIAVAATIAPAFTLSAEGYILSADGRNFVSDEDLMRKANVNGQIGSFVSFYSKNLKWQIGPVLNYQLLSSFKDVYPVKEHLVDYGIRIGLSK